MTLNKTWREPLVLRLLESNPGRTAEDVVEAYADERRREAHQDNLPVDVEGIASLLGIRRRIRELPFAGRVYVEESGQLVMDLNEADAAPRRRFTCAHEVIHLVFPGFRKEARYRVDQHVGGFSSARGEEEYLCDVGAATLLMPPECLTGEYDAVGGLSEVERLANDACVSLEAAGNRLVALAQSPTVFLVLEWSHKPADMPALRRGQHVDKRLRVRYAVGTRRRLHVPRFKSADDRSVFVRALEMSEATAGRESLPGTPGLYEIEARAYPRHEGAEEVARVLAIARPHA